MSMQVSVEATEGLERKMVVGLPQDQMDVEIEKRLKNLVGRVSIKGFRPGKVPFAVVRKRYGEAVKAEVLEEKMKQTFYEAVQQEELKPAGMPQFEVNDQGDTLSYTATFEVFPDVTLNDFSALSIEEPVGDVTDADIDDMLEKLREQHAQWDNITDRPAQAKDRVVIDFIGRLDGEAFEGGSGEGVPLVLGSGQMIPGFESGLEGVQIDETRDLVLTFPEDYHEERLAGKETVFTVTTSKIEHPQLPEIDDAFAQKLGVSAGTVDGLREELKKNMQREMQTVIRNQLKQNTFNALSEANPIEIPKALVTTEIGAMKERMMSYYGAQMKKSIDLPDQLFEKEAQERVHLMLLVHQTIEQYEVKPDAELVKARIEEMASVYDEPEEFVRRYQSDREKMVQLEGAVLEEQVMRLILEKATVTEKPITFKETSEAAGY